MTFREDRMERYELVEGSSSKFWEVLVEGSTLSVRFGRIGTNGQTKDKDFDSAEAATKEKNKLVKEKIGKGYALAGAGNAPVQATPEPAAAAAAKTKLTKAETDAAAPVESTQPAEGDRSAAAAAVPKLPPPAASADLDGLLKAALPTRSRPGEALGAGTAWQRFAAGLKELLPYIQKAQPEAGAWLAANLGETGPKSGTGSVGSWLKSKFGTGETAVLSEESAMEWARRLQSAVAALPQESWRVKSGQQALALATAKHFAEWYMPTAGGARAATVALRLAFASPFRKRHYSGLSWVDPFELAWRHALVKAPEAEYEKAVEVFAEACAKSPQDWVLRATSSFMLADDRSTRHELQPLAVLQSAQAAGIDVGGQIHMFPLLLDAPPAETGKWRTKRSYYVYFAYCQIGMEEAVATALAVARHHEETAMPILDWLYAYANEDERTLVAHAMLAADEPTSFATVAPYLHDKWVRAGLDKASQANLGRTFRQLLNGLASGRSEPIVRARAIDTITKYDAETLNGWVAGDAKAQAQLERMGAVQTAPEAAAVAIPAVLRDPPWRKKAKARDDIILKLAPIATPLVFSSPAATEPARWRAQRGKPMMVADLPAFIAAIEAKPKQSWQKIPAPTMALPKASDGEDYILLWLKTRLAQLSSYQSWEWQELFDHMEQQPDPLALALWESGGAHHYYHWRDFFHSVIKRFGERAIPGLVKLVEGDPSGGFEQSIAIDSAELAPLAARAVLKLKKARVPALAWLRRHRRTAITRLIPDAVGKPGAARDVAEHMLRWYVANTAEGRTEIDATVDQYAKAEPQVREAVDQVLNRDPLARFPARRPSLPAWFLPAALTTPELKSGGALPASAVTGIAEMLAFSTPDAIYPGVEIVKQACTPRSLGAFSWDLFSAWMAEGAPSKESWMLRGVGWLGDDECARQLTRLIRKWPGEAAHQRAVTGLDVLADIGSDLALMNLNGIAEKVKFKGLQERARDKIAALAEARDLTPEELADRLAPDLDLDERGGLDIDFGERKFRAGFDEFLRPWVKDMTGQRLKDLPKPNKSDDAELSAAATARWGALKKDARAVASLQISRLENMLSSSRRTAPDVFWTFFASHPLIRHLAQRLVWGVYHDGNPSTAPATLFRVTDDLSLTDAQDEPISVDFSENAKGLIGLVHPLHLPAGGLDAWGALFGDYEISQPFAQLGRETFTMTDAEKASSELSRFDGVKVESPRLRGMPAKGWQLGSPQDGGGIWWIERKVRLADGNAHTTMLSFSNGLIVGASEYEDKDQTLGKVSMLGPYDRQAADSRKFGELDAVTQSEMLRGLTQLAETGTR